MAILGPCDRHEHGDGLAGDTYAAAGIAYFLRCGRFHINGVYLDAEQSCQLVPHRGTVGPHLRSLADQRYVHVADGITGLARQSNGMLDEAARRRAAPLPVAWGVVLADVAVAASAEYRIDHRVQDDVGIAVPGKAAVIFDPDAAKPQLLALRQPMHIVADADPRRGG